MIRFAAELWLVATLTGMAVLALVMVTQRAVRLVGAAVGRSPRPVQLEYAAIEQLASPVSAAA